MPSRRTMRTTPPAPGSRPSVTSGRPSGIFASSSAMRWCAHRQISQPPPSAAPLIAATTGLPSVSMARSCSFIGCATAHIASAPCSRAAISSLRSAPAKKVDFAERRITPASSLSPFSFATASASEARKSAFIRLADSVGLSKTRWTMFWSSFS